MRHIINSHTIIMGLSMVFGFVQANAVKSNEVYDRAMQQLRTQACLRGGQLQAKKLSLEEMQTLSYVDLVALLVCELEENSGLEIHKKRNAYYWLRFGFGVTALVAGSFGLGYGMGRLIQVVMEEEERWGAEEQRRREDVGGRDDVFDADPAPEAIPLLKNIIHNLQVPEAARRAAEQRINRADVPLYRKLELVRSAIGQTQYACSNSPQAREIADVWRQVGERSDRATLMGALRRAEGISRRYRPAA